MDEKRRAIEALMASPAAAATGDAQGGEALQLVIVRLAGALYAFRGTAVTAIARVGDIVPVPGTADYVPGVMYHQGRVESVIDIRMILGLPAEPSGRDGADRRRVVIGASGGIHSGLLVDAVEDVVDLPRSAIHGPLQTIGPQAREFVAGETRYREQSVVIVDLERVFETVLERADGPA